MPFQTAVNTLPGLGVAGDFAGHNPRIHVLAGPGSVIAGPSGVNVGTFAWLGSLQDNDNAPTIATNSGYGPVAGFVGRQFEAAITTYLAESSMNIPQAWPVPLYSAGDFLVKNSGSTYVTPGMNAYAAYSTGLVSFATGTSAASSATCATSTITNTSTFSVTGGIVGNLLTVSAVSSGTIYAGATISGTSVTSGTQILAQLTPLLTGETAGGAGRYSVSYGEQSVSAGTTISGTNYIFTLGATASALPTVGGALSGGSISTAPVPYITQAITPGTASGSLYATNAAAAQTSTTITFTSNVATKFVAVSGGAAGELIKMTSWLQG